MKARILIVDDILEWREIFTEWLEERYDYEIDTAASLRDALDLLKEEKKYHLVVTDIGLTEEFTNEDGLELLRFIQKNLPGTRTIAVSGRAAKPEQEDFKKEFQVIAYLDRHDDVLNDREGFYKLVEKGVAESLNATTIER